MATKPEILQFKLKSSVVLNKFTKRLDILNNFYMLSCGILI